ncbi:MAG: phosphatase PAP2 family protein [Dyella sp.]
MTKTLFKSLYRRGALLALSLLMLSTCGGAAFADTPTAPRYLTSAQLSALQAVLPPPSAAGSAEDRADRDVTERAFATHAADEFAQAQAEEKFDVFDFASVLGPDFSAAKLPLLAALFKQVKHDTSAAVDVSKNHWRRLRPCPAASECAGDPNWLAKKSFGYPSGHSTRATVDALLLAQLFPQQADALLAQAYAIGWRRVVLGVHTPQDIQAGRVYGQALSKVLLAEPAFRQQLAAVAQELKTAGIRGAAYQP